MATIVKLPQSTIQIIAAGEVITRPVNVVKELLENSIDAGCNNIRVRIEKGGVKLIEIIDNGHGIARANAELLCRRHTTSKLKTADDLTRMSTFGFRGEALASISEMAELEVKTFNMKSDKLGWQAKYKSGELVEQPVDKYLQNPGTHLKVTNLFSQRTLKHRKAAMKSSFLDEKKFVIELIMRYAIHYREKITMSLNESNSPDLICLLAPMSFGPCIGMFFGHDMEDNLIEFHVQKDKEFEANAHVAVTYKKSSTNSRDNLTFILFVNDRLVDCADLKREVDVQIQEHLSSKQYTALVYIGLKVPACDVDVNTHPSKATVELHYKQEIIALIVTSMRTKLKEKLSSQDVGQSSTHQKTISQLLIGSQSSTLSSQNSQRLKLLAPGCLSSQESLVSSTPARRPHDLIHTDPSQTTLKQLTSEERRIKRDLKLKSIHDLRILVSEEKTKDCADTIKNSVFVGLFDHERALIQHGTKLYAINLKAYLKEQYYQFYLFDFANFPPIEILPPGNKIRPMIETYFDDVRKHDIDQFTKFKFQDTQSVIDKLMKFSDMFEDYLSMKITQDEILTLPCIIPDEVPNLAFLGRLLVHLANYVDFTQELTCLKMIGRLLADFYSEAPVNLKDKDVHKQYHDLVETKLYVAIKNYLLIPEWLFQRENICQISDTKDLYKVFERC